MQYKILILACTIFSGLCTNAQFTGGIGDGFDFKILNEGTVNVDFMFKGGSGDGFAIASTDFTLPVTFGSFTAAYIPQSNATKLEWQTFTEINTDYFTAQQSTDNAAWRGIARVAAAGNSNVPQSYTALHNNPATGKNFYRIVTTDKDGRTTIGAVKVITVSSSFGAAIVFNNPVTDVLNLQMNLAAGIYNLSLLQADGRQIAGRQLTLASGTSNVSFDLHTKPAGIYYITVRQQDGTTVQTLKVLNQ